ncbi:hypothetical protein [Nocardia paucivorans]|uniref:hypothetical protein n=1 Tax=Nocardia paucivorans TaxID=114259 RepID=UPI0005928F64|nr:hypothetical protein [Nocardia paucivorans]
MFVDGLTRKVAQRLRTCAVTAGRVLYRDITGPVGDVRRIVENFVTIDARASRVLPEIDPTAPRFVGRNVSRSGKVRIHEFTPDRIRSAPILDSDKNVVGVHFPSKLRDNKASWTFTCEGLEKVSAEYGKVSRVTTSSAWKKLMERIFPIPGRPRWIIGKGWPAPWPNENLIFPRAHAGPDGYDVHIKVKLVWRLSRWVRVTVDGKTYGRILAANEHFNAAYDNIKKKNSGKPVVANVVQLSCAPARGPAARESFESLNAAGTGAFDVYAPKGTQVLGSSEVVGYLVKQNSATLVDNGLVVRSDIVGTPKPWGIFKT